MTQERLQEIYQKLETWKKYDGVPPVLKSLSLEEIDELIELENQKQANFKIIYIILSTLEKAMDNESFDVDRLSAANLDITEPKRKAILAMLLKNGYVEGFQVIQYTGDPTPNIEGLEGIRITLKGLEYLEENSLMQKAARLAKGIAEVL